MTTCNKNFKIQADIAHSKIINSEKTTISMAIESIGKSKKIARNIKQQKEKLNK